jgi:hypothetical protein
LREVAEVHDVGTPGKVEGDVDRLLAGGPGRFQHHLHLHVVGVPLRSWYLTHITQNSFDREIDKFKTVFISFLYRQTRGTTDMFTLFAVS